ncbi:MAG: 8-oxo-dGTP diphosphatase MutT [Halioglobus sp.]
MNLIHVAVGVIIDADNRILIARRNNEAHQGGLWEFPGGKVEAQETIQIAMARELHEELGIEIGSLAPLLEVRHDYGDKQVLLDVHVVRNFSGEPEGREGQPLKWVSVDELPQFEFPAANVPIVEAVQNLLSS